jgi:hypothetical protein
MFSTRFVILVQIGNPTWLPGPIMCSDWLKLWKSSCQKLLGRWNCNIIEMITGWSSTEFVIFVPIAYPRWPPQGNNSLPLDPMGISFKDLFFFRNYLTNWVFCIMWMFLGWFYTWSIILVQIGNPTWLPGPIMCSNTVVSNHFHSVKFCYFRPPDHMISLDYSALNFRCQCTQQKLNRFVPF